MGKTTAQLRTIVRKKLRDPNGTMYDDNGEIDLALQNAQMEIIQNFDFRFLEETHNDDIVSGTTQYDFPTDIMSQRIKWLKVLDAASGGQERELVKVSYEKYQKWMETKTDPTGVPTNYCLDEKDSKFILYPEPDYTTTGSTGIIMRYVQEPTDLTTDSTATSVIPDEFSDAIIYKAMAKLILDFDTDSQLKDEYEKEANKYIANLRRQWSESKDDKQRLRFHKYI